VAAVAATKKRLEGTGLALATAENELVVIENEELTNFYNEFNGPVKLGSLTRNP
jgi:hypothetical protein